jgi:hypothetical protein
MKDFQANKKDFINQLVFVSGSDHSHLGGVRVPGLHRGAEDLHLAVQGQGPPRHCLHRRSDLLPSGLSHPTK